MSQHFNQFTSRFVNLFDLQCAENNAAFFRLPSRHELCQGFQTQTAMYRLHEHPTFHALLAPNSRQLPSTSRPNALLHRAGCKCYIHGLKAVNRSLLSNCTSTKDLLLLLPIFRCRPRPFNTCPQAAASVAPQRASLYENKVVTCSKVTLPALSHVCTSPTPVSNQTSQVTTPYRFVCCRQRSYAVCFLV